MLKTSVLEFGLASWSKKYCKLFIPLESVPILEEKNQFNQYERVIDHEFLRGIAQYPVLCLDFILNDTNENDWIALRQLFSTPGVVPFPIFDTRIAVTIQDDNEDSRQDLDDLSYLADLEFESRMQLLFAEWSAYVVSTDMFTAAPAKMIEDLIKQMRNLFAENENLDAMKIGMALSFSLQNKTCYWTLFKSTYTREMKIEFMVKYARRKDVEYNIFSSKK